MCSEKKLPLQKQSPKVMVSCFYEIADCQKAMHPSPEEAMELVL